METEFIETITDGEPEDSSRDDLGDSPGLSSHIGRIVYQIQESQSGKDYQAYCPELLVTAFGDSPESAKEALRVQVVQYLEDCDSLGTLDEALIEAGFYFDGEAWLSNEVYPVKDPKITMFGTSATLPLSP